MANDYSLQHVSVSLSPQERFDEYLQSRAMRNTQQRRTVLEHVFSHHDHFDVETLIEQLPDKGEANYVSRPTVYRTLTEFVDAGLLRKFELGGRAIYEHDYGYPEHDHMVCNQCNQFFEFHSDEINNIRESVAQDYRFRVTGHRLLIFGICSDCAQPRRQKRKQDLI